MWCMRFVWLCDWEYLSCIQSPRRMLPRTNPFPMFSLLAVRQSTWESGTKRAQTQGEMCHLNPFELWKWNLMIIIYNYGAKRSIARNLLCEDTNRQQFHRAPESVPATVCYGANGANVIFDTRKSWISRNIQQYFCGSFIWWLQVISSFSYLWLGHVLHVVHVFHVSHVGISGPLWVMMVMLNPCCPLQHRSLGSFGHVSRTGCNPLAEQPQDHTSRQAGNQWDKYTAYGIF